MHFQQLEDELDSKATAITNLTRQVSTLESERRQLHENIYDAETALKTAAQDRHTLSNYVETLTNTFNKVCHGRGQSINGRRVGAFPTTLHVDMFFNIPGQYMLKNSLQPLKRTFFCCVLFKIELKASC